MILDCRGRLFKANEDLQKFVDIETDLEEGKLFIEALKIQRDSESEFLPGNP